MNLPKDLIEEIKKAICRPEGTIQFRYRSAQAFAILGPPGVVIQICAGGHLFRLERTSPRFLSFLHASSGTGTRVATIDLTGQPGFDNAFLAFTWSPGEIRFYLGPPTAGAELLSAVGVKSARQFRVLADGGVAEMGSPGLEVIGLRVYENGQPTLAPTAIEAWESTLKAVEVLWTGRSDQGQLYETVLCNFTLIALVTGFEAYGKTRFLEIETEGIAPDTAALFDEFFSRAEKSGDLFKEIESEAAAAKLSVLRLIVDKGRVNFQNYQDLKRAFNRAYAIKLGETGISSKVLDDLQRFIQYRHRIVHVSTILGLLNQPEVPAKPPVFANRPLADAAIKCFDQVVRILHAATLKLRRKD